MAMGVWSLAVGWVVAAGAPLESPRTALLPRYDVASQGESRAVAPLGFGGFTIEGRHLGLGAVLASTEPPRLGRAFAFGYSLDGKKTLLTVRAGCRYGVPADEAVSVTDDSVVLTSGGTLSISAGTVAWLEIAFDGFRELAGARMTRLDAIPGFHVRAVRDLPVDLGAGFLASFRREDDLEKPLGRSFAGVLQVSGRF